VLITEPFPICIKRFDEPLVDTKSKFTVIRFTHDGIEVKSMLVPDVEATAVPEVISVPPEFAFDPTAARLTALVMVLPWGICL